jgi:hypothetical protein
VHPIPMRACTRRSHAYVHTVQHAQVVAPGIAPIRSDARGSCHILRPRLRGTSGGRTPGPHGCRPPLRGVFPRVGRQKKTPPLPLQYAPSPQCSAASRGTDSPDVPPRSGGPIPGEVVRVFSRTHRPVLPHATRGLLPPSALHDVPRDGLQRPCRMTTLPCSNGVVPGSKPLKARGLTLVCR